MHCAYTQTYNLSRDAHSIFVDGIAVHNIATDSVSIFDLISSECLSMGPF